MWWISKSGLPSAKTWHQYDQICSQHYLNLKQINFMYTLSLNYSPWIVQMIQTNFKNAESWLFKELGQTLSWSEPLRTVPHEYKKSQTHAIPMPLGFLIIIMNCSYKLWPVLNSHSLYFNLPCISNLCDLEYNHLALSLSAS